MEHLKNGATNETWLCSTAQPTSRFHWIAFDTRCPGDSIMIHLRVNNEARLKMDLTINEHQRHPLTTKRQSGDLMPHEYATLVANALAGFSDIMLHSPIIAHRHTLHNMFAITNVHGLNRKSRQVTQLLAFNLRPREEIRQAGRRLKSR